MDFYCEEFIGSKTCSLIRHFLHKHTGMLRCAASTQRCSITKMTHCKRRCGVRRFTLPVQVGLHATDTSQRVLIHLWSTWTSRLHVSDSRRFKNIKRTITDQMKLLMMKWTVINLLISCWFITCQKTVEKVRVSSNVSKDVQFWQSGRSTAL